MDRYLIYCVNPDLKHQDSFEWEFNHSQDCSGSCKTTRDRRQVVKLISIATDGADQGSLSMVKKGSRWFFQLGSFSGVIRRLRKGQAVNLKEEAPEVWAL